MYIIIIVPSDSPRRLRLLTVNTTAAHLTWTPPHPCKQNGLITGYNVVSDLMQNFPAASKDTRLHIGKRPVEVYLTLLKPDTSYSVSVAALTEVGEGPFSSPLIFKTNRSGIF